MIMTEGNKVLAREIVTQVNVNQTGGLNQEMYIF